MTLLVVAVSLKKFEQVDRMETVYLRSPYHLRLLETKVSILNNLCLEKKIISKEICEQLELLNKKQFNSLAEPFDYLNQKALSKNKILKKEITSLIYHRDLLMEFELESVNSELVNTYKEFEQKLSIEMQESVDSNNLLSKANMNWMNLTIGQFTHAGYAHLIGNLLFMVFLSVFVELRVGILLYPMFFLIPGFVGFISHFLMNSSDATPLMGASANISGIAGAFTLFFWNQEIKALLFTFIYNRVFLLPVSFYFPVLIFAGDLVGALNSKSAGVAHIAHLGGFLSGALLAYILVKLQNLPKGFLFPFEYELYLQARQVQDKERHKRQLEILTINQNNNFIHSKILEEWNGAEDWNHLHKWQKLYTLKYLPNYIKRIKTNPYEFLKIAKLLNISWPLKKVLSQINIRDLLIQYNKSKKIATAQTAFNILNSIFILKPELKSNSELANDFQLLTQELAEREVV